MPDWTVERARGGAGALHARGVPATLGGGRRVEVLEPTAPALVLGSAQRDVADTDACTAEGVEVVRRQSGGGAVLVEPEGLLWVDVLIAVDDPLWTGDVSASARWLGAAWSEALRGVGGVDAPTVHEGSMCLNRWGRLVCFAGLGPGEVTDGAGGPKVVGIAQRRTRHGARFQCAVALGWDPLRLTGLLRFASDAERAGAAADLSRPGVVRPVDPGLRDGLLAAFHAALPRH
ncbi:MAG TPA: hypothetical protein VFV35_06265 [Acidimicrobiales bacterium]|nr:hypothetical protein [Acidimicrobiales bacterium]